MTSNRIHPPYAVYTFVLPALIVYTAVLAIPVVRSTWMSFNAWDGLTEPVFNGLANYRRMVGDPDFFIALRNGVAFALLLLVYQVGLGSLFAFVLAGMGRGVSRLVRDALFIPVVLSVTVVSQLWLSMYNPEFGLINRILEVVGVPYRQNWLGRPGSAIWAVALVNAWQFMGYHLILIFTAVKAIPEAYYEAAAIEGAGPWRRAVSITIPLLTETYRFTVIIAVTAGFRAFEHIAIMTGGGPGTSTFTLTFYMYRAAFRMGDFGLSSASVTVLVVQCLIATWVINRIFERRSVEY